MRVAFSRDPSTRQQNRRASFLSRRGHPCCGASIPLPTPRAFSAAAKVFIISQSISHQRFSPSSSKSQASTSRASTLPAPGDAAGFEAFDLAPELQRAITAAGFLEPRPIQVATIPAALAGHDILGLSHTGSGKTAAFALPILAHLLAREGQGPRALIIAPTRELATQIESHVRTLAQFTRIKTVTVFGGVSEKSQIGALRAHPDIVVACPGRLLDLWSRGAADLRRIETLVIDEADHMFDLGFMPDIRRILAALPAKRQNLLFSATMPPTIRTFADRLLHKPHVVELTDSKPASSIEHVLCPLAEQQKVDTLRALLRRPDFESAIVFSRTKRRAKNLADRLSHLGHRAIALQGNMSQPQRERAMRGFSSGRFEILVATDIAARGIDVAGISYVVNFDVPTPPEAYTHRIGRTGRAECSGQAFTFVTPNDGQAIRAIERMLGAPIRREQVLPAADGAQAKVEHGEERGASSRAHRSSAPRSSAHPHRSSSRDRHSNAGHARASTHAPHSTDARRAPERESRSHGDHAPVRGTNDRARHDDQRTHRGDGHHARAAHSPHHARPSHAPAARHASPAHHTASRPHDSSRANNGFARARTDSPARSGAPHSAAPGKGFQRRGRARGGRDDGASGGASAHRFPKPRHRAG
jgi:superfamily II DNA/RNA helicase